MSIEFKLGDLFSTDAKYICHQVNCMGKMGSGIARAVREKFPNVYKAYTELCSSDEYTPDYLLGSVLFVRCGAQIIANLFAQRYYGRDGSQYTDYKAFRGCLQQIRENVPIGSSIAFPHGIGCGLGGGKWEIILPMIEEELSNDYEIEVWKYGV